MSYTQARKYTYKLVTGEEPKSLNFRDATRWTDLRAKLNELGKGEWLKVELEGEDSKAAIEQIRQACYNWADSDLVNLRKRGMRVMTATQNGDAGDIVMWIRVIDRAPAS